MIAISATDRKLTASMDLRFGKSPYFLITDGHATHFIANPYRTEEKNVPSKVVELLKREGITKIITGEVGPTAKISLDKNHIQIIMLTDDKVSLQHVLKKMGSGY
ncbi:MAG: NifB/NifX family molybdenum-iron cluster-binding protein [Prolixibacteraceae bacterium]